MQVTEHKVLVELCTGLNDGDGGQGEWRERQGRGEGEGEWLPSHPRYSSRVMGENPWEAVDEQIPIAA